MKSVWKYTLDHDDITAVMPKGAEILSVMAQGDDVCMWALVDPNAEKERRRFLTFGTGHPIPEGRMKSLGSVSLHGGRLIVHAFEAF
jgi:hypothetical protein